MRLASFSYGSVPIMTSFIQHCIAGASVWKFASTEGGVNPDVYVLSTKRET